MDLTTNLGLQKPDGSDTFDIETFNTNMDLLDQMWKIIYPIGAIYMSANNTSPEELFGGTWVQLENRFLLGAGSSYTAGNTGGEAKHTLTTSELPSNIGQFVALRWASNTGESGAFTYTQRHQDRQASSGSDFGDALYTLSGGGAAHNNMPPYLVVYIWKRTA